MFPMDAFSLSNDEHMITFHAKTEGSVPYAVSVYPFHLSPDLHFNDKFFTLWIYQLVADLQLVDRKLLAIMRLQSRSQVLSGGPCTSVLECA